MNLIEIADAIDAQIVRMQKVRAVLITLLPQEEAFFADPLTEAPELDVRDSSEKESLSPGTIPQPVPVSQRKRREIAEQRPRVRPSRRHVRELRATALSGAVPQGTIVISAADAVRSRPVTESPAPGQSGSMTSPSGHSLDDLIRQLSRRTSFGLPDRPSDDSTG